MYIFTEKDKSAILEMFTALLVYYFINEVPKEITKFNDSHQYKMFQSGCNFADDVYGRVFVMRTEVKQVHHNPNDLIAQFV